MTVAFDPKKKPKDFLKNSQYIDPWSLVIEYATISAKEFFLLRSVCKTIRELVEKLFAPPMKPIYSPFQWFCFLFPGHMRHAVCVQGEETARRWTVGRVEGTCHQFPFHHYVMDQLIDSNLRTGIAIGVTYRFGSLLCFLREKQKKCLEWEAVGIRFNANQSAVLLGLPDGALHMAWPREISFAQRCFLLNEQRTLLEGRSFSREENQQYILRWHVTLPEERLTAAVSSKDKFDNLPKRTREAAYQSLAQIHEQRGKVKRLNEESPERLFSKASDSDQILAIDRYSAMTFLPHVVESFQQLGEGPEYEEFFREAVRQLDLYSPFLMRRFHKKLRETVFANHSFSPSDLDGREILQRPFFAKPKEVVKAIQETIEELKNWPPRRPPQTKNKSLCAIS